MRRPESASAARILGGRRSRALVGREMDAHAVTDLILIGDRRPYHLVAAEEARS
jgi:hypothetical protein